ncbi:MAG: hypothetical protein ACP5N1_02080 [Candidatus Woesearchaeota archaeon]
MKILYGSTNVFNKILLLNVSDAKQVQKQLQISPEEFRRWYTNEPSTKSYVSIFTCCTSKYDISLKTPALSHIEVPGLYYHITMNQFMYYILLYVKDNLTDMFNNIKEILYSTNPHSKYIYKIFMSDDSLEDFNIGVLSFYPVLKWFYSKETKHLYSRKLLEQMKNYEKELDKLRIEDFIKESQFRLTTPTFPNRSF